MSLHRSEVALGRYQALEQAGETALWLGFLGHDLQAHADLHPGREMDVMLKVVRGELAHDEPSRSFVVRELQRVRTLSHPSLSRPSDVQLLDGQRGVLMVEATQAGLSQGLLLSRMVSFRKDEGEAFTLAEVRKIGVQLASVLGYVHAQLMCHGDLRLESVLLHPGGLRLGDVGLGRALPRGPYLDAVTRRNELHLLAPEVRAGRPPDVRADVFGLAALYRHLLSLGEDPAWQAFQAEHGAIAAVLLRGLADDPQARYPSVEALVADVESVAITGTPMRRRHAPTPLAMAVAAGRLPMEELNRPVEELVPEGRRRRNSASFEVGAVLAPLSNSPSARISLGTLPPLAPQGESARSSNPPKAAQSGKVALSPAAPAPPAPSEGPAGRSSTPPRRGKTSRPPADSQGDDIGEQYTRPVGRLDSQEMRRPTSRPPEPSGSDLTLEQMRLDPALLAQAGQDLGLASRPPRNQIGASARFAAPLDPGDMPTNAVDLLPEAELDETPMNLVAASLRQAGGGAAAAAPGPASDKIEFRPLPAPSPASPIPVDLEQAASPTPITPSGVEPSGERVPRTSPRSSAALPRISSPSVSLPPAPAAARRSGGIPLQVAGATTREAPPTRPMRRDTPVRSESQRSRVRPRPSPRLAVMGALVLAAVVGALTAVLAVTALRWHAQSARKGLPSLSPSPPSSATSPPAPPSSAPPPPGTSSTPSLAVDRAPSAVRPASAPTRPPTLVPVAPASVPVPGQSATPRPVAEPLSPGTGGCPAGMVRAVGKQSFCIDRNEYPGAGQFPKTDVSLKEAAALCQEHGERLCTGDEWELACRGAGLSSYPYGHDARPLCNTIGGALKPTGSLPHCVSASGAMDMAGNAAEWVAGGAVRGGSTQGETDGRCSRRVKAPQGGRGHFVGFRCCR